MPRSGQRSTNNANPHRMIHGDYAWRALVLWSRISVDAGQRRRRAAWARCFPIDERRWGFAGLAA
ncbi:hypothetical protein NK6_6233 [Bradyrhizobium diazoefficiens]|uniref:Uncharacterized protein n=1 Tax=Bradyrhizobium diazoefficiens TaxID=1355477 RepID=A0A0E4BSX1_9BRAD|nr:hypothetical protein NK6_6233 [Bradyrhizobium diazoefficiens]